MKKQLLTLVMMIALVTGAGSVMASTPTNPQVGSIQTYSVDGLDALDVWTFKVSLSTENLQDGTISALLGTEYSFEAAATGVAPTAATTSIKWLAVGNYRVWIEVKDESATGCSNYRFVDVTVTDNNFNVSIIALGTGDNTTTDIPTRTADVIDCPRFIGENFDSEDTDTEGSTYAYFKVTRTVTTASTANWAFTPTIAGTAAASVTKWESSNNGTDWADVTIADEFVVSDATGTTDDVWFRATVPNTTETSKTLIFNYGATAVEKGDNIADQDDSGLNTATLTISPLPAIGSFTNL